jgi:UDP-glucose-4-epimerase GalE
VAGGAGYIGSHTAKALSQAGFEPVVLDNLSTGHAWAVKWGPLVVGDIGDEALVRKTVDQHKIEAVIHFAASAYVGVSMTHPREYFENNSVNTFRLLNALQDSGVPNIVFSSTCATYGDPIRIPIDETHPQLPVNPYGESKLFVEKLLKWYGSAYGLRSVALRYFNASGGDPDGEIGEVHDPETHLIPLILNAASGGDPIKVFGDDYPTEDGTAIRDYIHVNDLADAHIRALKHLRDGGASGVCNLGTGRGNSVREVIQSVERVTGRKVPAVQHPRRAGDPPQLIADNRRAKELLGWVPDYTEIDRIVETAWRWHTSPKPVSA